MDSREHSRTSDVVDDADDLECSNFNAEKCMITMNTDTCCVLLRIC